MDGSFGGFGGAAVNSTFSASRSNPHAPVAAVRLHRRRHRPRRHRLRAQPEPGRARRHPGRAAGSEGREDHRRAFVCRAGQGPHHRPRAGPGGGLRQQDAGRHRDLQPGMAGQERQPVVAGHPRPQHPEGRGPRSRRQVERTEVRTGRQGSDPRQQADHRSARASDPGARHLFDLARSLRPAVAGTVDDRGQEDPVHVQPVAADPRAFVGAAAGHADHPLHLQRARHRTEGRDGADERGQRSGGGARRRLQLQDAAEDPVLPARHRRRRPGVQADRRPQRRMGGAGDGRQGGGRIRRHRQDDRHRRIDVRPVPLGPLRPAGAAAELPLRRHGEPAPDLRHPDRDRRRQVAGVAGGA